MAEDKKNEPSSAKKKPTKKPSSKPMTSAKSEKPKSSKQKPTATSSATSAASAKKPVTKTETTPAKPGKQRIRIRLKAYDHKVVDQSARQIVDTALRSGATIAGPIPLPTRRSTFTVVKSPHVFKKGREQFEMRVHKRLIDVLDVTPKTIDSLMNLSLPAGCDAEIKM